MALSASAYAVWTIRQPHPSLIEAESTVTQPAPPTDVATPATELADPHSEEESSDAAESTTATSESDLEKREPTVKTWAASWSDEADLLVIGDGFTNLPTQWVQLWARQLGQDRPVRIHHWGEAADVAFNDPIVLSESDGPPLTVWSAGRAGSTIQAAAQRYERFVDASAPPDAVLITLGLSSTGEDVSIGLNTLVGDIDEDVPVLIVVAPEGLYEPSVSGALMEWAKENEDRVAVVDLRRVAPTNATAEQWATAFMVALDDA